MAMCVSGSALGSADKSLGRRRQVRIWRIAYRP
jgi:hypothetical protein